MNEIHLIGNAHLDPVWLWRWQEGYAEVLATFRSALDRIKEFDEFIFTCSSAQYYAWVEEADPEMFEEIKQSVIDGKWVIVGGQWIQPDCNAPCGESFARHSLYSQLYFKEKFGVTAKVGYNVDSFGHSAMIPQIMKLSGMNAYVYMRPQPGNEKQYPFENNSFLWFSPDGTGMPVFRIPKLYCTRKVGEAVEKAREMLEIGQKHGEPMMAFYGIGNHGGGPTIENILSLKKLLSDENGEHFVFSSPERFFSTLDKKALPEYHGDLQHHASGCYSALMELKSLNRRSEARLLNAEKFDIVALLLGLKKKPYSLKKAWLSTLFNQFHDIMGGCIIKSVVPDAMELFGESLSESARVQNFAQQLIAWNINTSKENPVVLDKSNWILWEKDNAGTPVVVFNPHSFPVKAPIRIAATVNSVKDDDGNEIAVQEIRSEVTNGPQKTESTIIADVEPFGWRLYWVYLNTEPETHFVKSLTVSERYLENEFIRVEISKDGYISGIIDKTNQKNLINSKAIPEVMDETHCDTWAHNVFEFDKLYGVFEMESVSVIADGNVCVSVRIKYKYGNSTLVTDISLFDGIKKVYIDFSVNWQEKHKVLKLCFPTPFTGVGEMVSVPYGFLQRTANGKEQPMQKWVAASENGYGIGIATDTRCAYDFKDGKFRITALRSPIYADHYGQRDELCEYTEQGEQSFRLSVMPVYNDYNSIYKAAEELLTPMNTIFGTYHKGRLASHGAGIEISDENIMATALKAAEDGKGYILRCHEACGKKTETEIKLPFAGVSFTAVFNPQEIKTFRIYDGNIAETDFLEQNFQSEDL